MVRRWLYLLQEPGLKSHHEFKPPLDLFYLIEKKRRKTNIPGESEWHDSRGFPISLPKLDKILLDITSMSTRRFGDLFGHAEVS